jgi:NAD(P)-dependent dehydrogenase (short-subunit alcohol dehydrogenase family)
MIGGGTGIGLMQTLALAQNGAKVFITSRNADKLNDVAKKYESSGEIVPIVGDITSKDGISKIVEEISKNAPNGINVLYIKPSSHAKPLADDRFNNAGIAGEGSREGYEKSDDVEKYSQQLLRSEFKEWDDILRTNVTAHYVRPSHP